MAEELQDDVKAISLLISVLDPLDDDARILVLDYVLRRLKINLAPVTSQTRTQPSLAETSVTNTEGDPVELFGSQGDVLPIDIRSFAEEKKPSTVNEKVAVVGYYLAHLAPEGERKESISAGDIKKYFIQANLELPSSPERVTLMNAKNAGYFDARTRGQYSLNSVGYNLVAHKLPGSGNSEEARRKPTKKRANKAAKKKITKTTKRKPRTKVK
ncbi:MAG: hypothetical protein GXP06_01550 [Alphaproteobacteria bacterium]|nr:hypothetical protein [Alphaproteobacteria bacterium]